MHVLLVFILPALFFTAIGFFIHMFSQGVKNGIYQKSVAPKSCGGNCKNCVCKKGNNE